MKEIFNNENTYYRKIVSCCCFMAFGTIGLMNCYGMFYSPMAAELQKPFYVAAIHMSITLLVMGMASPLVLRLLSKMKFRLFILISSAVYLIAGLMIGLGENLIVIYSGAALRGIGLAGCSILILNYITDYWFVDYQGIVMNHILTVSTIAALVMPPAVSLSIELIGFRNTYVAFTVLVVLCCLPVALNVELKPEDLGMQPFSGRLETAADEKPTYNRKRKHSGWLYAKVLIFSILVVCIPTVFLMTFSRTKGLSAMEGGYLISTCMLGNFLFKTFYGKYKYEIGVKKMILENLVLTVAGLIFMKFTRKYFILIMLGCFLYGSANVNAGIGISELVYQVFGDEFVESYTDVSALTGIVSALATSVMGYSYSYLQSFDRQINVLIGIAAAAFGIILLINRELKNSSSDDS